MWGCFKSTSPKNPSLWLARLGESGTEWDWTTWRAKCLERSLKLQSPDRSEHYSDVLPHLSSYFLLRCKTRVEMAQSSISMAWEIPKKAAPGWHTARLPWCHLSVTQTHTQSPWQLINKDPAMPLRRKMFSQEHWDLTVTSFHSHSGWSHRDFRVLLRLGSTSSSYLGTNYLG